MRTHTEIIRAVGATALARGLGDLGMKVHQSTPQRWADRNSIPGQYWAAIASLQIASLEELAAAADARTVGEAA
jgi:hypothetical protein